MEREMEIEEPAGTNVTSRKKKKTLKTVTGHSRNEEEPTGGNGGF